jgi:hypothetical protein
VHVSDPTGGGCFRGTVKVSDHCPLFATVEVDVDADSDDDEGPKTKKNKK